MEIFSFQLPVCSRPLLNEMRQAHKRLSWAFRHQRYVYSSLLFAFIIISCGSADRMSQLARDYLGWGSQNYDKSKSGQDKHTAEVSTL